MEVILSWGPSLEGQDGVCIIQALFREMVPALWLAEPVSV